MCIVVRFQTESEKRITGVCYQHWYWDKKYTEQTSIFTFNICDTRVATQRWETQLHTHCTRIARTFCTFAHTLHIYIVIHIKHTSNTHQTHINSGTATSNVERQHHRLPHVVFVDGIKSFLPRHCFPLFFAYFCNRGFSFFFRNTFHFVFVFFFVDFVVVFFLFLGGGRGGS
jgi:hypothetical protein